MDNLRLSTGITTTSTQNTGMQSRGSSKLPTPVMRNGNLTNSPTLPESIDRNYVRDSQVGAENNPQQEHELDSILSDFLRDTEFEGRKGAGQDRMRDEPSTEIDGDKDVYADPIDEETMRLIDEIVSENRSGPSDSIDTKQQDETGAGQFDERGIDMDLESVVNDPLKLSLLQDIEKQAPLSETVRRPVDEKPSFREAVKKNTPSLLQKMKTTFKNIKFNFLDFVADKSGPMTSRSGAEAKLDRKHAYFDKSGAPEIKHGPHALEAFANLKWTGDTKKDEKTFLQISNQLSTLSSKIYAKENEYRVQINDARKKLGELESKKTDYKPGEYESEKKRLENSIFENQIRLSNEGSYSVAWKTEAKTVISKASQLHLSELDRDFLLVLKEKFIEIGHESKAIFIDSMITELADTTVTATKDQLAEMRAARDEELLENYTSAIDYKVGTSIDVLNKRNDKVSINLGKILIDMKSDFRKSSPNGGEKEFKEFRDSNVDLMISKSSVMTLENFNETNMRFIAKQLRLHGNADRADLLDVMISKISKFNSPEYKIQIYKPVVEEALSSAKTAHTFLRSGSEKLSVALRSVMNAQGMAAFEKSTQELLTNFCKNIKDDDVIALRDEINEKKITTFSNQNMTTDLAEKIANLAIRLQQDLAELKFDDSLKNQFVEFSKILTSRPNIEEGVNDEKLENGLTEKDKNIMLHQMFADQLFLKTISPVMSNYLSTSKDKEVKLMAPLMKLVSVLVQRSANQQGLLPNEQKIEDKPKDKAEKIPENIEKHLMGKAILLANAQDEMFVNFGMRKDAMSKKMLNLPEVKEN